MAWNYRDRQDITILWRHPKALDFDINSDVILLDIHDVVSPQEFTQERIEKVTKIMFKSEVHRKYYPQVPDNKCVVIPHGLDVEKFEKRQGEVIKNPYKIINTSSPDRSLLTNLELIERIYNKLPDDLKPKLKFRWNYGFRVWDTEFDNNQQMRDWKRKALGKLEELKIRGIVEEGSGDMISQEAIVDQYLESGLMLYPSEFFEIGFISGNKAALAGAIPVTTDVFAQGEFLHDGIVVHSDVGYTDWAREIEEGIDFGVQDEKQKEEFIDKIVDYFKDPMKYHEMRIKIQNRFKETFSWDKTANEWTKIFKYE
jgi:glycosyltransferase involved in cell wall biosynthesis